MKKIRLRTRYMQIYNLLPEGEWFRARQLLNLLPAGIVKAPWHIHYWLIHLKKHGLVEHYQYERGKSQWRKIPLVTMARAS